MNYNSKSRLAYDPMALKSVLSSGLMSFPLTDFDEQGEFDAAGYRARLEWLMPYGATVLVRGRRDGRRVLIDTGRACTGYS